MLPVFAVGVARHVIERQHKEGGNNTQTGGKLNLDMCDNLVK